MVTRILVDSNVLYARTLRDWLLQLQVASGGGMFTTAWTEDIRAEVAYHLRRNNLHMEGTVLTRICDRITDSMTERIDDYSAGVDSPVADLYDRHVHAAAVAGQADIVMTGDKGFLDLPEAVTDELPYEVCNPDQVFMLIDDGNPRLVREITRHTWDYWRRKNPGADIPGFLIEAGCPDFAERVRGHIVHMC